MALRAGVASRHGCVKASAHRRSHAKRCVRALAIGGFRHADAPGANRLRFAGRLHGRRLHRGSYALRAVARNGGGETSAPLTIRFRIVG
jgi:hypothetical protein